MIFHLMTTNTRSNRPVRKVGSEVPINTKMVLAVSADLPRNLAALLGGAILTEKVFNLPGLGRLSLSAVVEYYLPIIVGATLLSAAIVIAMNLIVDILYAFIDPRVRVAA